MGQTDAEAKHMKMNRTEIEEEIKHLQEELDDAQQQWENHGDGPSSGYMEALNEQLRGWEGMLTD